jgi:hypothetical protein
MEYTLRAARDSVRIFAFYLPPWNQIQRKAEVFVRVQSEPEGMVTDRRYR